MTDQASRMRERDNPDAFIDADDLSDLSEDDFEDDDDENSDEVEGAYIGGMNEVMDQDWDNLAGDLTKRFNRLKAHVNAKVAQQDPNHQGSGTKGSDGQRVEVLVKPALNSNADREEGKPTARTSKVSEQLAQYSKYASAISLDVLQGQSGSVTRKGGSERVLNKDKSDRATNEQVLDPRTRLILFKMLGRGLISRIDGCVSTGKEANVYHAVSPEGGHIALKIYKTSILVFKDRDRYVTGEFRFRSGYARSNPRKMVRLWAEKELRNLRRMRTAGLLVPEAMEVRENVLVMQFLGESEWQASPRLKDAVIAPEQCDGLYIEMLIMVRKIFAHCKLVHADFSEYNVLWHEGHLWVIDVSQSVEHDHPAAFDFLRADLKNVEDFWARRGVQTLGLSATFAFVTSNATSLLTDAEYEAQILRLLSSAAAKDDPSAKDADTRSTDEAVFAQSYIPATLSEVVDPERDIDILRKGEGQNLIYADLTGLNPAEQASSGTPQLETSASSEGESDEEAANMSGSSSDNSEDESSDGVARPKGKKFEDKDEKKARKREVKEKAREKRAKKMPKAEKARRVKKTSGKR